MTIQASVAIMIVNWNAWQDSIRCIQSCLALNHADCRIILCDNASADGSIEHIERWAAGHELPADASNPLPASAGLRPASVATLTRAEAELGGGGDAQLLLIRSGGNLGFAGGNNIGLRWALARDMDYAWLLNNDAMATPDALTRLLARFAADPSLGLCGSTLLEYFAPQTIQAYAGASNLSTFRGRHLGEGEPRANAALDTPLLLRAGEIVYPVGASMIASRDFLRQVGLMDDRYFLYYEELDWVLRARDSFSIGLARDSFVYHKGGASAGSLATEPSAGALSFLYRSRLRVARKLGTGSMAPVVLGMLKEAARHLARGKTARTRAAFRALTGRVRVPEGAES